MKAADPVYRNLSCQYITAALLRLMEKEDYRDITVLEITQEAGVARRTFYLNYTSKDDVLDEHYQTLIREYDEGFDPSLVKDIRGQAEYFFRFWKQHSDYARLLEKNDLFAMLTKRFRRYMDFNKQLLPDMLTETEQEYSSAYVAGGLWMILRVWLDNDFREAPEELADIYARMTGFE